MDVNQRRIAELAQRSGSRHTEQELGVDSMVPYSAEAAPV